MKYNFPLLLKENDSVSMLLKYVQPNSTILEFGCANGRMTRFMHEELNCKVYIVEYDADAYQDAVRYAVDGVCGDIMDFEWEKQFANLKFDHIIFADVLEHLSNPKRVISVCQEFLKFEGTMLVSVPNIGHNDILIKLFQGRFEYTKTGLLDDTHIHFFSEKTVKSLFESEGFFVSDISCTVMPTGQTEQYDNEQLSLSPIYENIVNSRVNGEIYQFILELNKKEYAIEYKLPESTLKSIHKELYGKLYLDYGNGFNEENVEYVSFVLNNEGKYEGAIETSLLGVKKIRIDPVEGRSCIVHSLKVSLDSESLDGDYINSLKDEEDVLLMGPDPQVLFTIDGGGVLNLHIVFSLQGSEIYTNSGQKILATCSDKKSLDNVLKSIEEREKEISQLNHTIKILEEDHEKELGELASELQIEKNTNKMLSEKANYLENYIHALKNSRSWKITKPFRGVKKVWIKIFVAKRKRYGSGSKK